ncbi:hypothetical protein BDP27DRAFT_1419228 [Rhodocollybia butyracea]|uniref:F-box domain-containing protein n=1 Tax=Rhodocollybia butyracea TaxID=206335 RepID=A0A9P5PS03_9AGAR|nr:hypothetical protein BDP27DRAFT_1419228 [Rhodocollybia butyracea]
MARRSVRLQENEAQIPDTHNNRRKRVKETEDSADSPDSDDDYEPTTRRARKKSKKSPSKPKATRTRGLLERLVHDVPLDVIFEIFYYLESEDILRLAQTSRDLRTILMSKTSEVIWRTARKNVEDLPPRPHDLNEPQYAYLLYDPYCHLCERKKRCDDVYWAFRIRCCKKCARKTFPKWSEFYDTQPVEYRDLRVLPTESIAGDHNERYEKVVGNHRIAKQFRAEFETLRTPEARREWISRKKEETRAMKKHGRLCAKWLHNKLNEREDTLQDIRKQRKNDILELLERIGWHKEAAAIWSSDMKSDDSDVDSDFNRYRKLVWQPRKLTDHGWNVIKDELVETLSGYRSKRCYRDLYTHFYRFREHADLRVPFPTACDVLTNHRFEALIWDTPFAEYLDSDILEQRFSKYIPLVIDEWNPSSKLQDIMAILRKSLPNATIPDLQLVTTIFECTECKEGMYYPEMFHHECCCKQIAVVNRTGEPLDYYLPKLMDYQFASSQAEGRWTSQKILFSSSRSKFAKRIVQACGLDPNTTTCTNSRLSRALIECLSCNEETPKQRRRCFMRWRCAVLGVHSEHLLKFDSFGQDMTQILAAEQNQYDSWALDWVHYFVNGIKNRPRTRCSHCHKSLELHSKGVILSEVQTHLQTKHKRPADEFSGSRIEELQEDWYWDPRDHKLSSYQPFWYTT